jgi:hypothetical protein
MSRAARFAARSGAVLLLVSSPVMASDYSKLPFILYALFGTLFAAIFAMTWFVTRLIDWRWLRQLVRCAVVAVFWSPVDLGSAGHASWWPVCMAFLEPGNAAEAPASILATTGLLWLFFLCLPRQTEQLAGADRTAD